MLDLSDCSERAHIAAALVHESTHGWLLKRGLAYKGDAIRRHERIALGEELRFLKRTVRSLMLTESERSIRLRELESWARESLKSEWYSPEGQRDFKWRGVKKLVKSLFR